MIKKLLEKKVSYIEFSEEELDKLGFRNVQKLEVVRKNDGSVVLTPLVKKSVYFGSVS